MSEATSVFPETVDREPALNFVREHFGGADLGHKKRNGCLLRVAEKICRHPGGTLPKKLANPTDYKAMDVLMNRPEVTHASVLAPHLRRTQERMAAENGVVLLLHDTTTLDYSGLSIPELGPVGNGGGRGYLCHNSLAVSPERKEVLGLANQILHRRVPVGKKEGVKAKRERHSRESLLWSQGVQAIAVPAEVVVIDVADRGADIFEFLALENTLRRRCVVRASYNRSIRIGHDGNGKKSKLFDHLRSLPVQLGGPPGKHGHSACKPGEVLRSKHGTLDHAVVRRGRLQPLSLCEKPTHQCDRPKWNGFNCARHRWWLAVGQRRL